MGSSLPSDVGARAEQAVASALHRAGWKIYLPLFAAHDRVDLVVESPAGELQRVQVKTATLTRGAVGFRVCSNTRNAPKDYRGEVDLFGVYSPQLDEVFLVPVDHISSTRTCHLRLSPARNGQKSGIRWADEYRLDTARGKTEARGAA